MPHISLDSIASCCNDFQSGLNITRQGVNARLEVGASFLKKTYEYMLATSLNRKVNTSKFKRIFELFSDIKICDSSSFELHESLAELYPGYGGNNSKAGLKIQTIYSIKFNKIVNLDIYPQSSCDRSYSLKSTDYINEKELLLTDLGYLDSGSLKKLMLKNAYFISKVKTNTLFYKEINGKIKKVNILDFLKVSKDTFDDELYIGGKKDKQIKCRVIAKKLDEKIVNQRIRHAQKKDKNQGRQTTSDRKDRLSWLIMITNIEEEVLKANIIFELYRLRWQIEILFKCWKSYFKLDCVKNVGKNYLECLLYGKLTTIILATDAYSVFNLPYADAYEDDLSILIFFKAFGEYARSIGTAIAAKSIIDIVNIFSKLNSRSKREKRKRRTTVGRLKSYDVPPVVNMKILV